MTQLLVARAFANLALSNVLQNGCLRVDFLGVIEIEWLRSCFQCELKRLLASSHRC